MMPMNLLQQLGSLIRHQPPQAAGGAVAAPASGAAALSDPIVAQTTQQAESAQAQPVPTEDQALQAESDSAWAANDFDRCIVVFSRLLQLHPGDANWTEKLAASYYNRGKQFENEGNEQRAMELYYSALSVSPDHGDAHDAAQQMVEKHQSENA